MNRIESFKDRELNLDEPVYVYRNLNKKGVWYSLKQGGEVKAHAKELNLTDCEFVINEKSRDRVRETGKKFPHAYVKGTIIDDAPMTKYKVTYNPKTLDGFTIIETNEIVDQSPFVKCDETGVYTFGLD